MRGSLELLSSILIGIGMCHGLEGDFKLNLKGRKEDGVVMPKQTIIWLKMQIDKQRAGAQLVLEYINIRLHHRVA